VLSTRCFEEVFALKAEAALVTMAGDHLSKLPSLAVPDQISRRNQNLGMVLQ